MVGQMGPVSEMQINHISDSVRHLRKRRPTSGAPVGANRCRRRQRLNLRSNGQRLFVTETAATCLPAGSLELRRPPLASPDELLADFSGWIINSARNQNSHFISASAKAENKLFSAPRLLPRSEAPKQWTPPETEQTL